MTENSNFSCPICKKSICNKLLENIERNGELYAVYFCQKCSIGFTVPRPSPESVSKLYDTGTYRVTSGKRLSPFFEFLVYSFRLQRKRRIEKVKNRGSILDIGCGRGLFLHIMQRNGWDVLGVELNDDTASYAREKYGITVRTGCPLSWDIPDETMDVITVNHVLEHLDDPVEMLSVCRRLLKEGGLLVVAVPNMDSLQANAGKSAWLHLDVPHHVCHFTERGLCEVLRNNGFSVVRVRHYDSEYNIFGWLQTLLNLSGISNNLLFHMLKNPRLRKNMPTKYRKRDVVLTCALAPIYLPLSVFLSVVESFFMHRGGTIEMFAVKKKASGGA